MIKYLSCFLILFIAGCASMSNQQMMNTLEETTRSYGKAIRWNYFDLADSFRKEPDRSTHETDFSALKKLRVTSYEVLTRNLSDNHIQAGQTVEIKFYRMSDMIEKTVIDKQDWQYDINEKKWYLHSSLPNFEQIK
jgi:hypothetical protein